MALGAPHLVKDINQTHNPNRGSVPENFISAGSHSFFRVQVPGQPKQLWTTDGTDAGTTVIADGAEAYDAQQVGTHTFLHALTYTTFTQSVLLRTDCTRGGTNVVGPQFLPGYAGPYSPAVWHDHLYFFYADTTATRALAEVDEAGTWQNVFSFSRGQSSSNYSTEMVVPAESGLIILTNGAAYRYDGSGSPQLERVLYPRGLSTGVFNGETYFGAGETSIGQTQLWKTTGAAGACTHVADIAEYTNYEASRIDGFSVTSDRLYFRGFRYWNSSSNWITQGTSETTQLLQIPSVPATVSTYGSVHTIGDKLYILAGSFPEWQLWAGTYDNLNQVFAIPSHNSSTDFRIAGNFADRLYFAADETTHGCQLWSSDGTAAGTELVTNIANGLGQVNRYSNLIINSNGIAFCATDLEHGYEPWFSDGTPGGTHMLVDADANLATGPGPSSITPVGNGVLFGASSETTYSQNDQSNYSIGSTADKHGLWYSNGTDQGTTLIKYLVGVPGGSAQNITPLNGAWVFSAGTENSGRELWRTDATDLGTTSLLDILPGSLGSTPAEITRVGAHVYFRARDHHREIYNPWGYPWTVDNTELWRSSGTTTGTLKCFEFSEGDYGWWPTALTALGSRLLAVYSQPYATDGSLEGTNQLDPSGNYYEIARNTSHAYFGGSPGLMVTDGTPVGSHRIVPTGLWQLRNVANFAALGEVMYFSGMNQRDEDELWRSDGTDSGTYQVEFINPLDEIGYNGSTQPEWVTAHNGRIYFTGDDHIHGRELYVTDDSGMPGAHMVADIAPGAASSAPTNLVSLPDGTLLFSASDPIHGRELWRVNEAGTAQLVMDVNPGVGSSDPADFTIARNGVYFAATTDPCAGGAGRELWHMPGSFGVAGLRVDPPSLGFGTVTAGDQVDRTVTLVNDDDSSYTVCNVAFASNAFSLVNPPTLPLQILAHSSASFTVRLTGSPSQSDETYMSFRTNDPANQYLDVSLYSGLRGAKIRCSEDFIDFGRLNVVNYSEHPLTIFNDGELPLVITDLVDETNFTFLNKPTLPLEIAPGGELQITVRFHVTEYAYGFLRIESNDPTQLQKYISVTGAATCYKDSLPTDSSSQQNLNAAYSKPPTARTHKGRLQLRGKLNIYSYVPTPRGSCLVRFYLVNDAGVPCRLPESIGAQVLKLKPMREGPLGLKPLTLNFNLSTSADTPGKYLLAVVDATNELAETNKQDNFVVAGPFE